MGNVEDYFDRDKIDSAIKGICSAVGGCTVAEAIQAVRSVDASLKGMYPELYGVIEGKVGIDKEKNPFPAVISRDGASQTLSPRP